MRDQGPLVSEEGWDKFEQSLAEAAAPPPTPPADEAKPEEPAVPEPEPASPEPEKPEPPAAPEPEKPAPPREEPKVDVVAAFKALDDDAKAAVREALGVAPLQPAEPAKLEDDPRMKAVLESTDPDVRAFGELMLTTMKKAEDAVASAAEAKAALAAREKAEHEAVLADAEAAIEKERHDLISNMVVDEKVNGKVVTRNINNDDVDQALAFMAENPGIARTWTIERVITANMEGARRRSSEPANGNGQVRQPSPPAQPTAVIVDAGASPSAPANGASKPQAPAKTIEGAVNNGMKAIFGLDPL